MVLYYAFGGGLGHLTRASAVLYTFGYAENDFIVVTSSIYANIVFKEKNIILIPDEFYSKPEELCAKLESIIEKLQINTFYVDSFPAGINGELVHFDIKNCSIRYIARLLNWNNYFPNVENFYLRFEVTYIIEALPDVQMDYILRNSNENKYINLKYPIIKNTSSIINSISKHEYPIWLIVHSGNKHEINILLQYAMEMADMESVKPEYLIVSQTDYRSRLNFSKCLNYYPACDFFPFVDKIFSACGFNTMAQTVNYTEKHHFIPFDRKFDDQFQRAKLRKRIIRNLPQLIDKSVKG